MQARRGIVLIWLSLMARLGSPKPVLTLQPNWPVMFTGETVKLRCSEDPHGNIGFFWERYEGNSWNVKHISNENSYTISPVTEAHSGDYRCADQFSSSDPVSLHVSAMSKATLTVEPKWHKVYTGETVTLKCEMDSDSKWTYIWYKDQPHRAMSQSAGRSVTGDRYTISGAAGSDQGQYWCEGRLEGRNVTSRRSDSITLAVDGPSVILPIAIGVGISLVVLILVFILLLKYHRNKGLLCLAWSRSDSSVHTQASTAVRNQPSPRDQEIGLSQAAGSTCDPLYSQAVVTNQRRREETAGDGDVVYSAMALEDTKKKTDKDVESGHGNVLYSTVRTG